MADASLLDRVSEAAGIEPFYWDISGIQHIASPATKTALLEALNLLPNGSDERSLQQLEEELRISPLTEFLPPVVVVRQNGGGTWRCTVHVPEALANAELHWRIGAGDQLTFEGRTQLDERRAAFQTGALVGIVVGFELELPLPAAAGYYTLSADCEGEGEERLSGSADLIVAPSRCYAPAEPKPAFGVSLQIASLVSENQLGVGDLGDLLEAVPLLAERGVDAIGVNPLHGLFEGNGDEVSPYSPSSRLNRNVLLLSVRHLLEWEEDDGTRALVESADYQRDLRTCASNALIDFREVYRLKGEVLQRLGRWFLEHHLAVDSSHAREFSAWRATASDGVVMAAKFSALRQWLCAQSADAWGWPAWAAEYRDPLSPAVERFCREHHESVSYHLWLQWNLDRQLQQLQAACRAERMAYGLYLDLALGAGYGGAETWANQAVYSFRAGAGAPPDELGPQGQAWGLPPYCPQALRAHRYRPFRQAVAAAMQHAGALRIDHIMSLCRLFWIPQGMNASEGGYIRYPLQDLLGIVALESQRQQCTIIGEDLGTVPDQVRAGMAEYGILSYKVLYFMNEGDSASPPQHYPEESLVVTSTHDLPTLWSFWQGTDIELRERLGLFDTPEIGARVRLLRDRSRRMICDALAREGLWDAGAQLPTSMSWELCVAIHRFLARAKSRLQMVQVEDLFCLMTQVNVPGTTVEHPNWRHRLPTHLAELLRAERIEDILRLVREERGSTRA